MSVRTIWLRWKNTAGRKIRTNQRIETIIQSTQISIAGFRYKHLIGFEEEA